jgi:hypothetical protein
MQTFGCTISDIVTEYDYTNRGMHSGEEYHTGLLALMLCLPAFCIL